GYAAAVATLFYYRRARSDEAVVFRMKGYPILPLIFIVAVLGVVASNIISNPTDAGMGLVIALLGLPVYWFWSRSRRAAARGGGADLVARRAPCSEACGLSPPLQGEGWVGMVSLHA